MKTQLLSLMAFSLFLVGCEKEDDGNIYPSTTSLSIEASINTRISVNSTSNVVDVFRESDQIGLYISTVSGELNNIPAKYNGAKWILPEEIENSKTVQAYYPYSAGLESLESVPVSISEQIDYLHSEKASVAYNVAKIMLKHAMSLVSVVIMKNDYNYEGKVSNFEIEGIPLDGQVNLNTGTAVYGKTRSTYKKNLNYTLDDYNPQKISTIVFPAAIAYMKEVILRVTIDEVNYSFSVPGEHTWEAGKEYTYTLNVYETFKPDVMEVVPVDVSYWNTYGKTDRITILDKPNQNLWFHGYASPAGKMTVKGEGQVFGGRITNNGATDWEGEWRYGMFDMAGNLVELYQPYHITVTKKSFDGGRIPCYVDCAPGKYKALPLFKDKGTNYWYVPRLQYEGLEYYTVLPSSANTTPSIRSERIEGEREAYAGFVEKKLNESFNIIITITNRAGVPLKGEIKAVSERVLTPDFCPYPITYMEAMGRSPEQWSDEIGRMNVDYSSTAKIQQEIMNCVVNIKRPTVDICLPSIRWYYKAEGTSEWTLMRCDYDHQFEQLKGITEFGIPSAEIPQEHCLRKVDVLYPAKNYTNVQIK